MRKSNLLLIPLLLIFWPSFVAAHDFNHNEGLFFNANSNLFRQKTDTRPWQLVSLPEQSNIKQSVNFDGHIWLVVQSGSKQLLYKQNQLLNFSPVQDLTPATEIVLKPTDSNLIVFNKSGTEVGLTIFRQGGLGTAISTPLVTSSNDLMRIMEVGGNLLYFQQAGPEVLIFKNLGNWQRVGAVNCGQSRLIEFPVTSMYCLDGTVLKMDTNGQWMGLNFAPVQDVYSSEDIFAGWDKIDSHLFHIWRAGMTTDIQLPLLSSNEVDQVVVSGSRILLKKKDSNWQELIWELDIPKLVELTDTSSGTIIPVAGSTNLMINGSVPQISSAAGQWQLVTSVGAFNFAHQTPLGLLIWNAGSLTQFAPTGSTSFTKVNPWSSTTSPIQAVEIGQSISYASVITQSGSGNANLYKTTDFTHWARVTLPTKPTLSPNITQARLLDSGSLVEISGVITVGPGVVDKEVAYIEDITAGIQVFLSQSNGFLPNQTKVKAVVTGEISPSITKRILLSSPADLELGGQVSWTQQTVNADDVNSNLGRSVLLKGNVDSTDNDYLSFRQVAGSLKVHFTDAKNTFQKDDQLVVPSVIDWNSASGKNEAWALSTNYQLISRAQLAGSTATTGDTSETAVAPKKTTTVKKATVSNTATSNFSDNTNVKTVGNSQLPVLVSGAGSTNSNGDKQTISMGIVSLLAGLLSFRGRRFRRFLPD